MTNDQIQEILKAHTMWLASAGETGERADLRGANLCRADLRGANLCRADLGVADLQGVSLYGANLREACLRGANLSNADLRGADLRGANLCGADLCGAINFPNIPMACPSDGSFIGWKKAHDMIVKLQIPDAHTDFIFAVIGEEFGFKGSVLVVVLIFLISLECINIARRAKDLAGTIIAAGMGGLIAVQGFFNIGVATFILPNTGLPMPFVSYGLTSVMSLYIGMGFVLNVRLQARRNNY